MPRRQDLVITVVGIIVITYVLLGDMKGTTWVQSIKAAILLRCVTLMTVFFADRRNNAGIVEHRFGQAIT